MPKCLHPPCPNQVADALYCEEHKYIPHWTTNVTEVEHPRVSIDTGDWPTYAPGSPRSAPRPAPILVLALLVLILAILAVGIIVILKLVF